MGRAQLRLAYRTRDARSLGTTGGREVTMVEQDHAATLQGIRPVHTLGRSASSATTGPASSRRTYRVPSGNPPPWWPEAEDRLSELLALREGWDTYSAPPVADEVVHAVIAFLWLFATDAKTTPWVVPTSLGGLQLEWHKPDLSVEVCFAPGTAP